MGGIVPAEARQQHGTLVMWLLPGAIRDRTTGREVDRQSERLYVGERRPHTTLT